ncbi:sigma-70 family RNA polymerase sigma factor [Salinibacterium sp. G-O1]|uniref:RNA polymerase sigma factor n=1 Tax=Salinibacterium sp. G-O1 TaxID=3046208 RepID=UPI0024BB334D|nr:sigma-70 family RNA polymerase sigma factor [Salinibacterium sp. G-O1]MDJ0334601.1 sigma-70 family RNA polymerase sigma factor [Salinibacterium sp. G-O1]
MPDIESESGLLADARGGDSRAFDLLLARHRDRLWGVCLRTTRNPADAEDALQDTLIAIWQNLSRFRGDSSFGTWIYRIAANAALTVVRKRREIPDDGIEIEDDSRDFVDALADRDRVQFALMSVAEDFRVALVLREYGQFSYEEIAQHQGILVATVKTRISRARAAVAAAMLEQVDN